MRLSSSLLALTSAALPVGPACAGRPLAVDDAGTAPAGSCQVESWFERSGDQRVWILSPACGLGEAVELGVEVSHPSPATTTSTSTGERYSVGLAVKWVDPAWTVGPAQFGLKAYAGSAHLIDGGWQPLTRGLLGLATLALGEQTTLHVNLGDEFDRTTRRHQARGQVALTWQAGDPWMLFGEVQALRGGGAAQQTLGARWWAVKDNLGLDLTAGRTAGQAGSTVWTLGLGWYGIGL